MSVQRSLSADPYSLDAPSPHRPRVGLAVRARPAFRMTARAVFLATLAAVSLPAFGPGKTQELRAQVIPAPEDHFGHRIGADRELVSWEEAVEYYRMIGNASDRVNVRETGQTTDGRPFLVLEISSTETVADLERFKGLQQRLYFQDHRPGQDPNTVHTDGQREELFQEHKAVVLITASIHATEVGAAQMSLELVHELATSDDPRILKILDNVIFLLVPSLNPDGMSMVVDWYERYVGTEYEGGSLPWLYQRYVGHDNNRDMYMYTQEETRLIGEVLWKEWFPSLWLDEHQMGSGGARIFVMPATDPINNNVHPLIYRLNGIFGQAQGAALEEAGKVGIIHDQTYTNFWPGAMAWTGWWHNQVGMLTEMASVRIATPTVQGAARLGQPATGGGRGGGGYNAAQLQAVPTDVQPRTNYPRPWLGGEWKLRDIVDYELIVSLATLEAAADMRERLNRQIYEVNRATIEQFLEGEASGGSTDELGGYGPLPPRVVPEREGTGRVMPGALGAGGTPYAVVFPPDEGDEITRAKLLRLMERAGVTVERATRPFNAGGGDYPAGTYVVRLAQVYGRYAKEMLEIQSYPEIRLAPDLPPLPPYDVTAWSLGLQMGVGVEFVNRPFEALLQRVDGVSLPLGGVEGNGDLYLVSPEYNDAFTAVNRLWEAGAMVRRSVKPIAATESGPILPPGAFVVESVSREEMGRIAADLGIQVQAVVRVQGGEFVDLPKPRIGIYQPWQSNMDEGWTRWVLEAYGFDYDVLHPQDFRAAAAAAGVGPEGDFEIGPEYRSQWPPHVGDRSGDRVLSEALAERYDVILFTHQGGSSILGGSSSRTTPEPYRMGLGEAGLAALEDFVKKGGRVVALGSASGLFIENWPIPVKNASEGLSREEFLIPGSIVNLEADVSHPLAWGMESDTHGFFSSNPFFDVSASFPSQELSVAVRYPNEGLRASGWLRGEEFLAGKAAVVEVRYPGASGDAGAGSLVLLGIRPQHRAQTHATFKLLFNALVNGG
jgi:hypothetical protein